MEGQEILLANIMSLIVILLGLLNYVFSALAIYKIAKVEKISKPWLSWVPIANSYMIIKVAGGNMMMMIVAVASFITGSTTTTLIDNDILKIVGFVASLAWSIYAVMMYNRLCDRYNVNILLFIASFIAPIALYIQALSTFYIPFVIIGYYANFKLYKNAGKGPISKVRVQSKIVVSNKKKKKK